MKNSVFVIERARAEDAAALLRELMKEENA